MSFKKLAGLVVCLVLTSVMLAACGGQQESSNQAQNSSTASTAVSSGSAASEVAPGGTKRQEVRIAKTEEDYAVFSGASDAKLNVVKGEKRQVPMGDALHIAKGNVDSEHGYYYTERYYGNTMKALYHPVSGSSILNEDVRLVGTYGDIPVVELDRQTDKILTIDDSNGNLIAYRCELAGCTVAFVDDENAIWNQNDLIPVGDLKNARFVDANGQSRANPLDWTMGEEVVVECGGQSYPMHADSYVYSVGDKKVSITGGEVKVITGNIRETLYGYDISKLEPGLYYFEGLGVYKVV